MLSMVTEKSRENRARRVAERRGYCLEKSRRRDPRSIGYSQYQLVDPSTRANMSLGGGWLTLAEAEAQLEIMSALSDPASVRLIRSVAALATALSPMAGLDPRTMVRLAGPVTAAAGLLGDHTIDELAAAVRDILAAPPPAPADTMSIGTLLDEVRAAFTVYEATRGRLIRPLTTAIPTGITRPLT
jgi:hypothetical protein